MADNSVQIARLQALLQSGATHVNVDGQDIQLDPDLLRQQLRDLMLTDTSTTYQGARQRPVSFQIDLSCF